MRSKPCKNLSVQVPTEFLRLETHRHKLVQRLLVCVCVCVCVCARARARERVRVSECGFVSGSVKQYILLKSILVTYFTKAMASDATYVQKLQILVAR
jgi:hypothetical protein